MNKLVETLKVTDYKIATGKSDKELELSVNDHLKEGYTLYGTMCMIYHEGLKSTVFSQALIKH